jgi:hypothetical protein
MAAFHKKLEEKGEKTPISVLESHPLKANAY